MCSSAPLGDEAQRFDVSTFARARFFARLARRQQWNAWVIMLPSQLRLFCDASAINGARRDPDPRPAPAGNARQTDRQFLHSGRVGRDTFGIEMSGRRRRTCALDRRPWFLVDIFVPVRSPEMEAEISTTSELEDEPSGGTSRRRRSWRDFRVDIERWLHSWRDNILDVSSGPPARRIRRERFSSCCCS
jgi:hypothetical protein